MLRASCIFPESDNLADRAEDMSLPFFSVGTRSSWGLFVASFLLVLISYSMAQSDSDYDMSRSLRSFPYSVSYYRILGHNRLVPYYGPDDELAAIIDSLNLDERKEGKQGKLEEENPGRVRRSGNLKRKIC
ncbi:hypothetical protein WR25_11195 [Diploscapter pachys]|uniref:Uncharacterized protein n=1 Tax=Diploscapter pachys TaxID=2018661 RepID=A0A2A2LU70_9BILA|nr:hypothetical protein WR25_11195 [Diploscapter pachys]